MDDFALNKLQIPPNQHMLDLFRLTEETYPDQRRLELQKTTICHKLHTRSHLQAIIVSYKWLYRLHKILKHNILGRRKNRAKVPI